MPSQQIDVYREWLKIADTNRPLDHYQLLRLPRFSDDVAKVRAHHHKMVEHVRSKYAEGEHAAQAKELVDELTRAMVVLTDAREKEAYDSKLGRTDSRGKQQRSIREVLLASKVVTDEQLAKAEKFAAATGFELPDAIIQQKLAPPDAVMQAYAESEGLPFIDLRDVQIDEELVPLVPAAMARQHSIVPVLVAAEHVLVAGVKLMSPEVEDQLRLRFDKKIRQAFCTPTGLNELVGKYYPREAAVAEMSGAVVPPTRSNNGGTTSSRPAAPAASDPAAKAERRKKRLQYTLIATAFGFMGVVFPSMILGWTLHYGQIPVLAAAFVVAGIAAGITWLANS